MASLKYIQKAIASQNVKGHMTQYMPRPLTYVARRPESSDAEPLRDSVDFSDLMDDSEERETVRQKK